MPNYRRARIPGASYFFTVTLARRAANDLLLRHIDSLRDAVRKVREPYPFTTEAWVVLPDHLHCIWTMPEDDVDYPLRWRLIKGGFSKRVATDDTVPVGPRRVGERGIWQRRYWEHYLRDQRDFQTHLDYVHYNPVKHGLVTEVADWPYSTFHRYARAGIYPPDWGGVDNPDLTTGEPPVSRPKPPRTKP